MEVLQSAHTESSDMLLRATLRSRSTALAIPGSRVRRFRLRSNTCDSNGELIAHSINHATLSTHLNVSEKVAVNVLHPRERVVRQAEGMELGKMVVIRNVELKFRLI